MRWIKDIPHARFKIQILQYNSKYIVKIELDQYEQLYKIPESDITSVEDLEKMVNPVLLENCLKRFVEMRSDWVRNYNELI